jgi:hypothetical protein
MTRERIQRFWDWFAARAGKIRADPSRHAPEISEMVGRLHDGFGWEMGGPKDGPFVFIVRCESSELRHLAHQVVSAAPTLKDWRISSWRLPMDNLDFKIQVGHGKSYDLRKFSIDVIEDSGYPFLHLAVTSTEFPAIPGDSEQHAGLLCLDALLGEKQVEDGIDSIEFRTDPPGKVSSEFLCEQVIRRLESVRSRPRPEVTDRWTMVEAKSESKVLLALVATGLGSALIGSHPWRVDVRLKLKETKPNGLTTSKELKALKPLEDRLLKIVESKKVGVHWLYQTYEGIRTLSFYVSDPSDLDEALAHEPGRGGYEGDIAITYDPRWREYRDLADQEAHRQA